MKQLRIDITEELHRGFKSAVAARGVSAKATITNLLADYVVDYHREQHSRQGSGVKSKTKLRAC